VSESNASEPLDPFVNHVLAGRYQITRVVADGGMGRVYEATQLGDSKRVAVKILHQDIAQDGVNIERFRREAETSHALEHANVVEVYDFANEKPAPGREEGAWYLVMEYLDGSELRAVLEKSKTLPIERVIRIIAQSALALDAAHAKGFVHRDLKPDNLFLVNSPTGDRVKLLDFGSVKFTRGQDRGQKLTVMGTTIGSPFYMSPEQARGASDLDHRADVWALGAMLYEMCVGQVPFTATNGPQILFKILGEEPLPPSFANDTAPPELDNVITKALCKDRDKRHQSCGELATDLGRAFGLSGSHEQWAEATVEQIATQLREVRDRPTAPLQSMPTTQQEPIKPSIPTASYPTQDEPLTPPMQSSPVMLYVALGGIVLVLIGAVYFAMSR
jgi:serine/threonine-protein kinase